MKNKSKQNIYTQMQHFADVTKALIMTGQMQRANRCLQIAEDLFYKSTTEMRNVISNIYVFSLTNFLEIHHCSIRNLFPSSLGSEYRKQINALSV